MYYLVNVIVYDGDTIIDIPLFDWSNMQTVTVDYIGNNQEFQQCFFDIFIDWYNNGGRGLFVSGCAGIRALINQFICSPTWNNYSWDLHQQQIILHGYSEIPTTFQDFLDFLIQSHLPGTSYEDLNQSNLSESKFYQYIKENIDIRLVIDTYNNLFIRLIFNSQQHITLPRYLMAAIELPLIINYMQSEYLLFTTAKKSQTQNIQLIQQQSKPYFNTIPLYTATELSNQLESLDALFYKYDNDLSTYIPAFLANAESLEDAPEKYKACIFYNNVNIGCFGNEQEILTMQQVQAQISSSMQ